MAESIQFIRFISTNVFVLPYLHLPHSNPSKNKNIPNKTILQYSRQIRASTINHHKSITLKNITNKNIKYFKLKLNKRPDKSKLYEIYIQNLRASYTLYPSFKVEHSAL